MKSISLLVLSLAVLGSVARADHSCLNQATNSELLNEIGRRLDVGGPGTGAVSQATFTCDQYNRLNVSLTNLTAGTSTNFQEYSNQCAADRDFFAKKLKQIRDGKIIAWCDQYSRVVKVLLMASGQSKLISQDYSNNCRADADGINAALTP